MDGWLEVMEGWRNIYPLRPDDKFIKGMSFSPDGEKIALARRDSFQLWSVRSCVLLHTIEARPRRGVAPPGFNCAAFSPDGNALALGDNNGDLWILRLPSLELVSRFAAHHEAVHVVRFSSDGKFIISSYWDQRLWNVSVKSPGLEDRDQQSSGLRLEPEHGNQFLGWCAEKLLPTPQDQDRFGCTFHFKVKALSPNGAYVAGVSGRDVFLWGIKDGLRMIADLDCHNTDEFDYTQVMSLEFSSDSSIIIVGCINRIVLFATTDGRRLFSGAELSRSTFVALSPNNQLLIRAARMDTSVWSTRSQERLAEHAEGATCAAFSPTDEVAVGLGDGQVEIWSARTGALTRRLGCHLDIWTIAITDNGRNVVSLSEDGSVRIVAADSGQVRFAGSLTQIHVSNAYASRRNLQLQMRHNFWAFQSHSDRFYGAKLRPEFLRMRWSGKQLQVPGFARSAQLVVGATLKSEGLFASFSSRSDLIVYRREHCLVLCELKSAPRGGPIVAPVLRSRLVVERSQSPCNSTSNTS